MTKSGRKKTVSRFARSDDEDADGDEGSSSNEDEDGNTADENGSDDDDQGGDENEDPLARRRRLRQVNQ
jgi:hypothetical protein